MSLVMSMTNREIVMKAVSKDGYSLQYASQELRSDREIVMAAVSENPYSLQYASEELRSDREIVMTAGIRFGNTLEYALGACLGDREIVMKAVSKNGKLLRFASEELRSDREIVMAAVSDLGLSLRYALGACLSDREIVMKAVSKNGKCLQYASEELKSDREIVMAAVSENPYSVQYASRVLRLDCENVMAAVSRLGADLEYAWGACLGDREIAMHAVSKNGRLLRSASRELRSDPEIVMAAVANNGSALKCASEEFLARHGNRKSTEKWTRRNRSKRGGGRGAFRSEGEDEKEDDERTRVSPSVRCSAAMAEAEPRVDDVTMRTAVSPTLPRSLGSTQTQSTTELLSTNSSLGTGRHRCLAESEEKLGSGAFAYVKKGRLLSRNRQSETPAAIKRSTEQEDASHEVRIMRALQLPGGIPHPHIVHFYGHTRDRAIAMELCDCSLHDLLRNENEDLSAASRCELIHQVSGACAWIVGNGVVHRDLKCANVLLKRKSVAHAGSSGWEAKVADFGLAASLAELIDSDGLVGTPHYMAPESLVGTYNEQSDVFSFGIIALETFLVKPQVLDKVFVEVSTQLRDLEVQGSGTKREHDDQLIGSGDSRLFSTCMGCAGVGPKSH